MHAPMHMCIQVCKYAHRHMTHKCICTHTHTQDQTLHTSLDSINQLLRWHELTTLALSHKYDRLVLAVWGVSRAPHSHRNWHLWARCRGTPQSRVPVGECSLTHLLQRCEFSLWVFLDWCWYNCFTFSVGEGKWALLKAVVVHCTSTWYYTRRSKSQRWAHARMGSPHPHWWTERHPILK